MTPSGAVEVDPDRLGHGYNEYSKKRDELDIYHSYGKKRRYLYHECEHKLIRWMELFPEGKAWPWEKKYLTEPAPGSQAEGAKPRTTPTPRLCRQ